MIGAIIGDLSGSTFEYDQITKVSKKYIKVINLKNYYLNIILR